MTLAFKSREVGDPAAQLNFEQLSEQWSVAPNYLTATKPAAASVLPGTIIFVSDGGAGNVFQGSTGSAWVALG